MIRLNFFDYILGFIQGRKNVVLSGNGYTYADDGHGNITITEV